MRKKSVLLTKQRERMLAKLERNGVKSIKHMGLKMLFLRNWCTLWKKMRILMICNFQKTLMIIIMMMMSFANIAQHLLITYTRWLVHLYCSWCAFHGQPYGGHLTTTIIADIVLISDLWTSPSSKWVLPRSILGTSIQSTLCGHGADQVNAKKQDRRSCNSYDNGNNKPIDI